MENRIKQLEKEYKEFKDAYIKNGKELVRMADALTYLTKTLMKHIKDTEIYKQKREEEEKAERLKIAPMLQWFDNMNFTKRTLMWILGLLASIGGLLLMYKEIFK